MRITVLALIVGALIGAAWMSIGEHIDEYLGNTEAWILLPLVIHYIGASMVALMSGAQSFRESLKSGVTYFVVASLAHFMMFILWLLPMLLLGT